jgi:hypothetical protein
MGVPGTDSDRGLRQDSNGKIIWVDPNHADAHDGKDGTNPDSPMRTVAGALTKCRAYSGDVIAVMHNAYWTYANSASIRRLPVQEAVTVTVPGVRIVGLSCGSIGVPWFSAADDAVSITVQAMDVTIEGFVFWNTGYTGTTGISAVWDSPPHGENTVIRHNFFYHLEYGIQLDYTYNVYVEDCRFDGLATGIYNPSVYGEPDYSVFRNNIFIGCTAAINLPDCDYELIEANRFLHNTAAIAIANGRYNTIHGNTIQGDPTGTNNMINLTGGASNLVSQNMLSCTIAQYDVCNSDATSGSWVGNLCTNGTATAPPV